MKFAFSSKFKNRVLYYSRGWPHGEHPITELEKAFELCKEITEHFIRTGQDALSTYRVIYEYNEAQDINTALLPTILKAMGYNFAIKPYRAGPSAEIDDALEALDPPLLKRYFYEVTVSLI